MIIIKMTLRLLLILLAFQQYAFAQSDTILDSLVVYDWRLKSNKPGMPPFKIGVDSEMQERDWITNMGDNMEMAYRKGQTWGAVFITIGYPHNDLGREEREADDYSMFDYYSVDLKGEHGGEIVEVALKDKYDPNDGNETKVVISVTPDWKTYEIPLKKFKTADLEEIHGVTVFVFRGETPRTVYFKNIKFIKKQ